MTSLLLLDGARLEQKMHKAREINPNHLSLYKDRSEEDIADVGPYLFTFGNNTDFAQFFIGEGWGRAWGFKIYSDHSFDFIYKHLRSFLLIKTEEGQEFYFRFYDPRVLRIFLPTCDSKQLKEFFGPVEYFICEDQDPAYGLIFSLDNNNLNVVRLSKGEIFDNHPLQKN